MRSGRTTRSSMPRSARSSNTARPTATRTRNPTRSCGIAGSTRITIAPTCCRSRNTASRSITTTSPRPGTASSRRTTSTRPRSSSRSAGRSNFWRIEAQTEKDFEWFEHKYPGWYAEFGDFWKWYAKLSVPGETNILFNSDVGYVYPHRCWSCMVPCLIREDMVCRRGRRQALHLLLGRVPLDRTRWPSPPSTRAARRRRWAASAAARMGRLLPRLGLADAIKDLGFVRSDGKTLVAAAASALRRQGDVDARSRARTQAWQPAARIPRALARRARGRDRPNIARASRSIPVTEPDSRKGAASAAPFARDGMPFPTILQS